MLRKLVQAAAINLIICGSVLASPIKIVAAENFYGELAKEIGGTQVQVQSIIENPDADPHLFATTPATSKALSDAQIIIYNGAGYDTWIDQMLANVNKSQVLVIDVSKLVKAKAGANPHLWYKPDTFPILAKLLASKIGQLNPIAAKEANSNLANFLNSYQQVDLAIANVYKRCNGTRVTATEPVFGYMAAAMGLKMEGEDFQWKVMNDTEPTPKMIADYQGLLNKKAVKILFYNNQVSDTLTKNMQNLARKNQIPVVGVSETMPKKSTIHDWLITEIDATNNALGKCK